MISLGRDVFYLPVLFSVFALLISIFSFLYHRSYLKRRTSQKQILSELREEVNEILKSINETTERDITLIEEREKRLKDLLNEIDRRLNTYIKELELRNQADRSYAALGKKRHRIKKAAQETEAPASPPPAQPELPLAPAAPSPAAPADSQSDPHSQSPATGEQVRSLLKAGVSPPIVAARLGLSISEVEFASALMERRGE